jgi:hypothetical protein
VHRCWSIDQRKVERSQPALSRQIAIPSKAAADRHFGVDNARLAADDLPTNRPPNAEKLKLSARALDYDGTIAANGVVIVTREIDREEARSCARSLYSRYDSRYSGTRSGASANLPTIGFTILT